jgi:hypothetical protein
MNGPQPSAEVRARVLAAVRAETVAPRANSARRRAWVIGLGFAAWAGASFGLGLPALRGRPASYVWALSACWLLVGIGSTWGGVGRGRSMLGRAPAARFATAVLTPVALVAAAIGSAMLWPQTLADESSAQAALVCLLWTIGLALGPLVAFLAVRRGVEPIAPRLSAAALAAAAGAWGALAIEVHCLHTSLSHVVLGHVLPVALLGVLGAVIGHRIVAVRGQNG